jgi:hypothetical protein
MPDRDAPEPPLRHERADATGAGTRGPGQPAKPDLAAIPTFLRDRSPGPRRLPRRSVGPADPESGAGAVTAAVAALPMAGLPPRRLVVIGVAIALVWMVGSFGRQVAEASAATTRADQLRAATAALAVEVAGLEEELQTVRDVRYITGAARAYRLGTVREIAFALEVGASPLGLDAPGSGSLRLGADASPGSPLESWLVVLFGPAG